MLCPVFPFALVRGLQIQLAMRPFEVVEFNILPYRLIQLLRRVVPVMGQFLPLQDTEKRFRHSIVMGGTRIRQRLPDSKFAEHFPKFISRVLSPLVTMKGQTFRTISGFKCLQKSFFDQIRFHFRIESRQIAEWNLTGLPKLQQCFRLLLDVNAWEAARRIA